MICKAPCQDAHHIIERRLWHDGGYYLDNGASLCGEHHIQAEQTILPCDKIREAAGIKRILLPDHMYADQSYDKWGNPILPNGQRLKGDLAEDESVQKIIVCDYADRVKYPRTYHLPWSPGVGKDDRVLESLAGFQGNVVITEKMDGENTSMYRDWIHARSVDSGNHASRNRVKAIWNTIAHEIPEGWRLCGENLYAKHSIAYDKLPGFFMLFSIWDGLRCLSWDETKEWASLLNLPIVPTIYEGPFNEELIRDIKIGGTEGYVVRARRSFHYGEFRKVVGKYVRANHVQTHGHWMREAITPNKLAE